jgi:HD-GYP domain-containing protein (c-di-GMP phosphodiesterase class II)
VAVPSFTLRKPEGKLSIAEREVMRLHPYQGGRILAQIGALDAVAEIVRGHHERYDGSGSPLGLRGNQIPMGAQLVAIADRFDDLTHDGPGSAARDADEALDMLRGEAGSAFAPAIVASLEAVLGNGPPAARPPEAVPGTLSEREAEVLRLASRGLTRRDIANRLSISEHTVRHHLSHIYDKIGVTTRVGATLWALSHDVFP